MPSMYTITYGTAKREAKDSLLHTVSEAFSRPCWYQTLLPRLKRPLSAYPYWLLDGAGDED